MVREEDEEFAAMQSVYKALEALGPEARQRVMAYNNSRLEIAKSTPVVEIVLAKGGGEKEVSETPKQQNGAIKYGSFAELFDAAQPSSNSDKVLVAGYWLQVCQSQDSWDSQSANTLLKNLGHGIANITNAIDGLKNQKPALALQLKKSGSSQQARKTYKVTVSGITSVETMTRG